MHERPEERVVVDITIAAPIARVWDALRDQAEIRQWFGWDYDGLEGEVEGIFGEQADADEEAHVLRMGDDRYSLHEVEGGTTVRVTRAAPAGGATWDEVFDEIDEGWLTFTEQLRFYLERHPGEERRTLYLGGPARTPEVFPPTAHLGLTDATGMAPGQRFQATTAWGEAVAGEVRTRTDKQVVLRLDSWGDALLAVVAAPPGALSEHGDAQVVLTTYGLDDAAFGALEERWRRWWSGAYG